MVIKEKDNSGTGYEDYSFILYNQAILPHKTTKNYLFDLNNKLNNPIFGSLVRSRMLLITFIVRVNSYMEVSSKVRKNNKHITSNLLVN